MISFLNKKVSLGVVLLCIDQFTKYLAVNSDLVIAYFNPGISFSLLQNNYIAFTLSVIVLGIVLYMAREDRFKSWFWIFIIIGAFGNIIDRIFYGAVVDFISIWRFPIFNFADMYINFGVLCFVYENFIKLKFNSD